MVSYNRKSQYIHNKMVKRGYYNPSREDGTILMLMITELTKLYNPFTLNKNEKLADLTMRLHDYCGYKNIKVSNSDTYNGDCSLHEFIRLLTNEFEGIRSDIETNHTYIKDALLLCYKFAELNDFNLDRDIIIKCKKLNKVKKRKI